MLNQIKPPQKNSSCLNSNQISPQADRSNKYEGMINDMSGSDTNNNNVNNLASANNNQFVQLSPDDMKWSEQSSGNPEQQTPNNCNMNNCYSFGNGDGSDQASGNPAKQNSNYSNMNNCCGLGNGAGNGGSQTRVISNTNNNYNITNNGTTSNCTQGDNMQWLEQALANPQLASSAKFLLQTTNFIKNCSNSSGNSMANNNAMNNGNFPSSGITNGSNGLQSQDQVPNSSGNIMVNNNAMNNGNFPPSGIMNGSNGLQSQDQVPNSSGNIMVDNDAINNGNFLSSMFLNGSNSVQSQNQVPSGNIMVDNNAMNNGNFLSSMFTNSSNSVQAQNQVPNSSGNNMVNINTINMFMNGSNGSQSQNQLQMQNQLQGIRLQGNYTPNSNNGGNHSSLRFSTGGNSSVASQIMSPGRQGARSVLSTSSQSSQQTAGISNVQGSTLNNVMFNSNAVANTGNSFQQQFMMLQQQLKQPSLGIQMNSYQPQQPVTQLVNQHNQQQQNSNQNFNQQQQNQFMNEATSQTHQHQQHFLNQNSSQSQQQQLQFMNQNQGLYGAPNNNFGNSISSNSNQISNEGIVVQHINHTADDLNDIEPADFRQDVSDDLDLSFLLNDSEHTNDDVSWTESNVVNNSSQTCTPPAPRPNAAPSQSAPVESQPGSSQQMQEHLREITKHHMQRFHMAHAKQQKKRQKKARKSSHGADSSNGKNAQGQNGNDHAATTETASIGPSIKQDTSNDIGFNKKIRGGSNDSETTRNAASASINSQTMFSQSNLTYPTNQGQSSMSFLMANGNRHQYLPSVGGGIKRNRESSTTVPSSRMPQMKSLYEYLESMLSSRGYSLTKLSAKEIGYITQPSPLQLASFGFAVCSSIKNGGGGRLSALLASGLSPNPVNKFGDSPFFLACKRGLPDVIKVFLEHGTDVRVADGFGRTALHYVAWANDLCFASAKLLLSADARLICVMDNHGNTPLDFVGDRNKLKWLELLESAKDQCWPPVQTGSSYAPIAKSDVILPDPPNALPVDLAEKVASGHVLPHEARNTQHNAS